NGNVGAINTSGTTTSFATSSDYRLKYNVQSMVSVTYDMSRLAGKGDHWTRIMSTRPVTFQWEADDSFAMGFIAHEFQEVYPVAVQGEKDGTEEVPVEIFDEEGNLTGTESKVVPKYQSMDNSFAIPDMIACLQDMRA